MRLRPIPALLLGLGALAAPPVAGPASAGFLDELFGGHESRVPPNPFASNYASAPPSPEQAARARRKERARRDGRAGEGGPVPPGRIPE